MLQTCVLISVPATSINFCFKLDLSSSISFFILVLVPTYKWLLKFSTESTVLPKLVSLTGRYLKYELVFILTIPSFNPNQILLLLSSNINVIKELTFSQIKINNEEGPLVLPIREGAYIKSRFRKALLGKNALLE